MNPAHLVRKVLSSVRNLVLFLALILVFFGLGVGVVLIYARANKNAELQTGQASLTNLDDENTIGGGKTQKLTVNANLKVQGGFYLEPQSLPSSASAGTIVFDKDTNTLQYYDGTKFVGLAAAVPQEAGGVTSLQGQTGSVTLVGTNGIAINGTTISNNGVLDVLAAPGGLTVSKSGGVVTVALPQGLGTTDSPMFAGLTVTGNSAVGSLTTNNIQQAEVGTDVTIDAGTDGLVFNAFGRSYILPSTGPGAQTICTTGITCVAGGGQTVNLAPGSAQTNNSGTDSSIFINNTGGANLLQLQNNGSNSFVVAQNGNTSIAGVLTTNTITPTGSLTVGAFGQQFSLQGNASSSIAARDGTNTTTVSFLTPTANTTISFPALGGGSYEVCTTSGNCLGSGGGANNALSNLSSVAINTSLLPGTTAINLGSNSNPFQDLYLGGTATNNFRITGTATAPRTITLPNASGTIAVSASGNIALSAAGNITFTGTLPVVNGGTGASDATGARTNLGAAASGANSDITSLSGLTTALTVVQGGTGTNTLSANGVLIGNGTSAITSVVAGGTGLCLVSTAGAPAWQSCPGGGGVSSVNTFTGAVTIQGTTNQVSVANNAGVITLSLPQSINTGASPTFAGLTLTSLTVGADTVTDLTGTGLQVAGNVLQTTLGTSVDLTAEVTGQLPIANGGTGATTAQGAINALAGLTTTGDLLYYNGSNATRLARGTNGQCLISNASTILWDTCTGDGTGVTTIGTYDSQTAAADGAVILGSSIYFQSATASVPGMVSTAAQTFAGVKTFGDGLSVNGDTITDFTGDGLEVVGNSLGVDSTVCRSTGNCVGGGSGGAPNTATYLTIGNNATLSAERAIAAGTNLAAVDGGANSTYTLNVIDNPTFAGLITANGGLTVETGDTFTFNGDAFTDLTGTGLMISGGALQATLGTSVDLTAEVTGTLPVANGGTGAATFTANGIVYGNGTGALQITAAGTTGQCLVGNTSAAPSWSSCGSGVTTIGTIDTPTTSVNGAHISGSTLYLQSATASVPGLVNTTTQTFAGAKTFTDAIQLGGASDVNQLVVKANASQTAPLVIFNDSSDDEIARLTADASNNLVFGYNALSSVTAGTGNIAIGQNTLKDNETGGANIAIGNDAQSEATGSYNVGIGQVTLGHTTGNENAAFGHRALESLQGASANTALGAQALDALETGDANVGIGFQAGINLTSGAHNIAIGDGTVFASATGDYQLNIGGFLQSSNYASGNLTIGTSDTTGQLLVLDTKSDSGDPTGNQVNGGMYYNSNAGKFRCYEGGAWKDCISSGDGVGANTVGAIDTPTTSADGAHIVGTTLYLQSATVSVPGLVNTGSQSFAGLKTFTNGLTVTAGQTFTFNGDAFTDLTGTGLTISSGALQAVLGTSVDLTAEVTGTLPIANGGTNATTAQAAINNISQLTSNGDLLFHNGTNSTRLARGTTGQCLLSTATSIQWDTCGGDGVGVTVVGSLDGQTAVANGATIIGSTIYLQSATGSMPGLVSTTTQTIAGNKTFSGTITVANITPSANLTIGTSDTTGTLLVVDTKTDAGDPAGVNGGMYYNSNAGKFRCYQNGAWADCIAASGGFVNLQNAYDNSTGGSTSEIKLDSTRGGLNIQDANASINGNLLTVQGSEGANIAKVGKSTIGAESDSGAANYMLAQKVTTGTVSGDMVSISHYAVDDGTHHARVALYAHDAVNNRPGSLIAQSGSVTLINGSAWNTVTLSTAVTSSTTYWIAVLYDNNATESRRQAGSGEMVYKSRTYGSGFPTTFGSPDGTDTDIFSYYMTVDLPGSPTLFSVNSTGDTLHRALANSSSLFQIQNADGGEIFNIDSTNGGTLRVFNDASGETGTWTDISSGLNVPNQGDGGFVTANGYAYMVGGYDDDAGDHTDAVYYSKLGHNGTMGPWAQTKSMPDSRYGGSSVVANGFIYHLGGTQSCCTTDDDVYYAKLESDGTVGNWNETTPLPIPLQYSQTIYANGYMYAIAGTDTDLGGSNDVQDGVWYAKVNGDGSLSNWAESTNNLPQSRRKHTVAVGNGYIYSIGGFEGSGIGNPDVYVAKLQSNGDIGAWTQLDDFPVDIVKANMLVNNGYLYVIGGTDDDSTEYNEVSYARINSDGTLGEWVLSTHTLPWDMSYASAYISNGYAYVAGWGVAASARLGSVLQVNGDLDLISLQGSVIGDAGQQWTGSMGGSLTAGNGTFVGGLTVEGSANFRQDVGVGGALTASAGLFRASTVAGGVLLGDFNGSFPGTGWTTGGNANWTQDTTTSSEGSGSATSGTIGDDPEESWLDYNYTAPTDGYLVFDWSVSSEQDWDFLIFCMDNDSCNWDGGYNQRISGVIGWEQAVVSVSAGSHSFRWKYVKDGGGGYNDDQGWIDNVRFVAAGSGTVLAVQNTAGTNLLQVDASIGGNIVLQPNGGSLLLQDDNGDVMINIPNGNESIVQESSASFEDTTTGNWIAKGTATISNSEDQALFGDRSLKIVTGTSANNGAAYRTKFWSDNTYTFTMWLRRSTSTTSTINIGYTSDGTDYNCLTGQTVNTTWTKFTCTITTDGWPMENDNSIYVKQTDTTTDTLYMDGFTLAYGSVPVNYTEPAYIMQVSKFDNTVTFFGASNPEPGPWQVSPMPADRMWHNSVYANGYMYIIGGQDASFSDNDDVYYAKVNTNGSIGSWSSTTAFPYNVSIHTSTYVNGYIYVFDGTDAHYARANMDGTIGSWTSTTGTAADATESITINGVIYAFGDGGQVYSTRPAANTGAISSWSTLTSLPTAVAGGKANYANGYLYYVGGYLSGTGTNKVYYAKVNSNGSLGSWTTNTNNLPANLYCGTSSVANGYIYWFSGGDNDCNTITDFRNYYAKLNNDGSVGVWDELDNPLPAFLRGDTSMYINGYMYIIGGEEKSGGNTNRNIFYARMGGVVNVNGSIDLVGSQGGNYANTGGTTSNGTMGGSITAGNGTFIGSLQVSASAIFSQDVNIGGGLNISGGNLTIGLDDSTGSLLVLDTKNTSGDPTGVNGAMYYNSNAGKFRCYQNSAWSDCLSPWITIKKPSDQDVTNSATLLNDSALQFSVTSGTTYTIRFNICYAGTSATGDYKGQFTFPSAIAAKNVSGRYIGTDAADAVVSSAGALGTATQFPAASQALGTAASSTDKRVFEGAFTYQANANGTLRWQFAQNSATTSTLARTCAGSFIEYQAL